ncbi:MAG: SDR family oxidoreductase [Candidatus Eremiobacteraeota bacterium]|nr:SDR family oxidoreductase [Candidatus Eremiobacteraeota bacterium]
MKNKLNNIKSRTYLVTGGAGFIGSNICRELLRRDQQVRVFDNFSTGRMSNLEDIAGKIEIIRGDLRDLSSVTDAVEGADFILHQGALPSVPRSVRDPIASNETNVAGTLNILVAARYKGVRRVVYASSSSVYGDTEILPKVETMKPDPLSPYALTKLTGEHYCRIFYKIYGVETVCLRYFNVFGPYQDPSSQYAAVVPRFITAYMKGEAPTIYGDGEQSRDFTYIENVVNANLLATEAQDAPGKVFNIACGNRYTVNHLAGIIGKIIKSDIKPVHISSRTGDVKHSLADITAAREILKYDPAISLEEGLRKTIARYYDKR